MIKARHSAGDPALARRFLHAIEPHVYRPELNFAAIKTALSSLEKIGARRRSRLMQQARERTIDVKLDRGGIRDIEFLVQCLQRVYGGSEGWLRSRGTLFALQKLHDKQHISGKDFQSLTSAYEFLRTVEHRMQLRHGQQAHRLPRAASDMQWLARSLGREGRVALSPEKLLAEVKTCMAGVAEIYQRVVFQEQSAGAQSAEFALKEPTELTRQESWARGEPFAHAELSPHARRNLERFLNSAATSSERQGAVNRSPEAVQRALPLFEFSDYLSDILVQYPTEVGLLMRLPSADRFGHD